MNKAEEVENANSFQNEGKMYLNNSKCGHYISKTYVITLKQMHK